MVTSPVILEELETRFGAEAVTPVRTTDEIPTAWIPKAETDRVLRWLASDVPQPFRMLYDLTAVDERDRAGRTTDGADLTAVYHLLSLERNEDIRLKVALEEGDTLKSVVSVWPNANWYEREAFDMFGIRFDGHPHLTRILMPPWWEGHPLRKDHPARATDMGPLEMHEEEELEAMAFEPSDWGMEQRRNGELMFLNVGPQHPGTHGVLRVVLQLDGEEIVDAVPDIGFHHRGAEKMAERQTWHTYIPYTDRVDYLSGVLNNQPYVMAVEKLAGIEVPDRARLIRIMLAELFRIASHLVWYGTFAQDVGALSPVFYMFNDRERIFDIIESVCGARMHPNWFRIGGVAQDLPLGWADHIRDFLAYMPKRLSEYDDLVMKNRIFKARTQGIGAYTTAEAIEWGVTGPGLRACGLEWDWRRKRPYGGYDQLEFEVPTAAAGDSYARAEVRIEEMRQSLRIIEQCVNEMPEGPYKALHPQATPPLKPKTMKDIETLIHHFIQVSWGPVIPAGEAIGVVEGSKGSYGYYLVSDGGIAPYRARIRAPSFPHMQMLPQIVRGLMIPDLLTVLGSIDFVLADVDR